MRVEAQLHTRATRSHLGPRTLNLDRNIDPKHFPPQLVTKYHLLLFHDRAVSRLPIMSKMWEVDPETRSKVRCTFYYRKEWGPRGQLRREGSADDGLYMPC